MVSSAIKKKKVFKILLHGGIRYIMTLWGNKSLWKFWSEVRCIYFYTGQGKQKNCSIVYYITSCLIPFPPSVCMWLSLMIEAKEKQTETLQCHLRNVFVYQTESSSFSSEQVCGVEHTNQIC